MKSIFLILIAIFTALGGVYADIADKTYAKYVSDFQNNVKNDDAKGLSKIVKYPLARAYPIKPVENEAEFIAWYSEIFDERQKELIRSVGPDKNMTDKNIWNRRMV
jgi:hypothetical protein